jgi:hypothetical protein
LYEQRILPDIVGASVVDSHLVILLQLMITILSMHGFRYPQISTRPARGMEGWLRPQISWGGYPLTHRVGMSRDFAPWISNGYSGGIWDLIIMYLWSDLVEF